MSEQQKIRYAIQVYELGEEDGWLVFDFAVFQRGSVYVDSFSSFEGIANFISANPDAEFIAYDKDIDPRVIEVEFSEFWKFMGDE